MTDATLTEQVEAMQAEIRASLDAREFALKDIVEEAEGACTRQALIAFRDTPGANMRWQNVEAVLSAIRRLRAKKTKSKERRADVKPA